MLSIKEGASTCAFTSSTDTLLPASTAPNVDHHILPNSKTNIWSFFVLLIHVILNTLLGLISRTYSSRAWDCANVH